MMTTTMIVILFVIFVSVSARAGAVPNDTVTVAPDAEEGSSSSPLGSGVQGRGLLDVFFRNNPLLSGSNPPKPKPKPTEQPKDLTLSGFRNFKVPTAAPINHNDSNDSRIYEVTVGPTFIKFLVAIIRDEEPAGAGIKLVFPGPDPRSQTSPTTGLMEWIPLVVNIAEDLANVSTEPQHIAITITKTETYYETGRDETGDPTVTLLDAAPANTSGKAQKIITVILMTEHVNSVPVDRILLVANKTDAAIVQNANLTTSVLGKWSTELANALKLEFGSLGVQAPTVVMKGPGHKQFVGSNGIGSGLKQGLKLAFGMPNFGGDFISGLMGKGKVSTKKTFLDKLFFDPLVEGAGLVGGIADKIIAPIADATGTGGIVRGLTQLGATAVGAAAGLELMRLKTLHDMAKTGAHIAGLGGLLGMNSGSKGKGVGRSVVPLLEPGQIEERNETQVSQVENDTMTMTTTA